jgi:hypothetical protein
VQKRRGLGQFNSHLQVLNRAEHQRELFGHTHAPGLVPSAILAWPVTAAPFSCCNHEHCLSLQEAGPLLVDCTVSLVRPLLPVLASTVPLVSALLEQLVPVVSVWNDRRSPLI